MKEIAAAFKIRPRLVYYNDDRHLLGVVNLYRVKPNLDRSLNGGDPRSLQRFDVFFGHSLRISKPWISDVTWGNDILWPSINLRQLVSVRPFDAAACRYLTTHLSLQQHFEPTREQQCWPSCLREPIGCLSSVLDCVQN